MIKFRMGNTKISDRGTSEVVLLDVWMDFCTLVAVQQRETARVLQTISPGESLYGGFHSELTKK